MQFLPTASKCRRYVQLYPQSCCAIVNFGIRRDARATDILRCTCKKKNYLVLAHPHMDIIPEALSLPKGMGRARILECCTLCAQN